MFGPRNLEEKIRMAQSYWVTKNSDYSLSQELPKTLYHKLYPEMPTITLVNPPAMRNEKGAPEFVPGAPTATLKSPPVTENTMDELTKKFAEMTAHLAQLQETITKTSRSKPAYNAERKEAGGRFERSLERPQWICDFCGEKGHSIRWCDEMKKAKEARDKKKPNKTVHLARFEEGDEEWEEWDEVYPAERSSRLRNARTEKEPYVPKKRSGRPRKIVDEEPDEELPQTEARPITP